MGDQVRMMCDYDGVPRPIAKWTMNDAELPDTVILQSQGRVLTIGSARVRYCDTAI